MSAEDIKETLEGAAETVEDKVEDIKESVEAKAEDLKEAAEAKAEDFKEVVEDKIDEVKEAVPDEVKDKVEDFKEVASDKIDDAKDSVKDKAEDIKKVSKEKAEDIKDKIEGKPDKDAGKSNSQLKREKRRKEVESARRKDRVGKIVGFCIGAVVAGLIIWGIVVLVMRQANKVAPIEDYSAGLDTNGYITGVTAADKVTLPEYKGIKVPYSEIEYTDESIDSDIESELSEHEELSTAEDLKVEDGNKVNISYVGTIDGAEFEGGSSDSYDLTIGSHSFVDDFEEQLIGAAVGDEVEVNVTFPDDYSTADLQGKDAVFMVNILGIYDAPELTDEFVAETIAPEHDLEVATVAEYRDHIRSEHEADNLEDYVKNYLIDNSEVKSYPSKYVKKLKGIKRYDDEQSYEYMNNMYQQYYGYSVYNSFEDYIGMTMTEYFDDLTDQAKDTCKENMIWQAIVEKEGAVADAAYYKAHLVEEGEDETYYDTQVQTSGEPFVLQQAIAAKALEIATDAAVVEK